VLGGTGLDSNQRFDCV